MLLQTRNHRTCKKEDVINDMQKRRRNHTLFLQRHVKRHMQQAQGITVTKSDEKTQGVTVYKKERHAQQAQAVTVTNSNQKSQGVTVTKKKHKDDLEWSWRTMPRWTQETVTKSNEKTQGVTVYKKRLQKLTKRHKA